MAWVSLCQLDELVEGEGTYVEIGGFQLAVFLDQGKPYAMDNRCPHAGGSISGGFVRDGYAVCPWHHWAFRLDTGALSDKPLVKVRVYRVRLLERKDGAMLVQGELPMF